LSLSSCCGSSAGNICALPAAPEHLNDSNFIDRELILSDKELLPPELYTSQIFFYQQRQKVEVLS
jgi:hypothetical protein